MPHKERRQPQPITPDEQRRRTEKWFAACEDIVNLRADIEAFRRRFSRLRDAGVRRRMGLSHYPGARARRALALRARSRQSRRHLSRNQQQRSSIQRERVIVMQDYISLTRLGNGPRFLDRLATVTR
jgi:hypothetical protein